MVATTTRSESASRVERFDVAERALHWTNAALFGVLLFTGFTLYFGPLAVAVGRRNLVKDIHVIAGVLLPVPLLAAYAGRWRAGLRADVRRIARWHPEDWRWLRTAGRDPFVEIGKFNAGQKVNATVVAASIPVMLATGGIMRWFSPFPLTWRTGATFVHDWTALVLLALVTGHVLIAIVDRTALRAMIRGWVPADVVERRWPRWHREQESE